MLSLTLLLLANAPLAQDLSKPLTVTSVAKPAKRLLEELSQLAGVRLMTATSVENEILVVRFERAPLSEAMKRIASVTGSEWSREADGYRLVRSTEKLQRNTAEVLSRGVAALKTSVAKASEPLSASSLTSEKALQTAKDMVRLIHRNAESPNADVSEAIVQMNRGAPAGRLFARLIPGIDVGVLASLRNGERAVFSTKANRMQRPIKVNDPNSVFDPFRKDTAVWQDAVAKAQEELGQVRRFVSYSLSLSGQYLRPLGQGALEAVVVFTPEGFGHSLRAEVLVYDESAQLVAEDFVRLGSEPMQAMTDLMKLPQKDEEPIEISALSKQLKDYLKGDSGRQLPLELRKALLEPEKRDPLSFIASDALLGMAKASNKNLVANLSDNFCNWNYLGRDAPKPSHLLRMLKTWPESVVTEDSAWIEVVPSDLTSASRARVDRAALGSFLRNADKAGTVSLEAASAFALKLDGPQTHWPVVSFTTGVLIPNLNATAWSNDLNLLRLYGTLKPPERAALLKGGFLSFGKMSPLLRIHIDRMVFGGRPDFRPRQKNEGRFPQNPIAGLLREATELLPNGLPADGYFGITSQTQESLLGYSSGRGGYSGQAFTPQQVAWMLYMKSDPGRFPGNADQPILERFRVANQLTLKFNFEVADSIYLERTLTEADADAQQTPVPLSALPERIRAEIARRVEDYKKAYESSPPTTGKKPPPQ